MLIPVLVLLTSLLVVIISEVIVDYGFLCSSISSGPRHLADFLSAIGNPIPITALTVIISFMYSRTYGIKSLVIVIVGSYLCALSVDYLKNIVAKPRTFPSCSGVTPGYSFPSGHAASSMFCALLVWFLFYKLRSQFWFLLSILSFCLAIGIAWSRVILGFHDSVDVVVGWSIALFWSLISLLAFLRLYRENPGGHL